MKAKVSSRRAVRSLPKDSASGSGQDLKSVDAESKTKVKTKTKTSAGQLLDPGQKHYAKAITAIWNERLPDVDASGVPLFSMATALGRQTELFYEVLLKPLGYQLSDYRLLVSLFTGQQQGMTPAQLNTILKQTSAGITKTIARLERRELVQRQSNPKDKRSIVMRLSAKGRRVVKQLCAAVALEQNKKLAWLSASEKQAALKGLKLLLQSMN